jgi:hypothetical protein
MTAFADVLNESAHSMQSPSQSKVKTPAMKRFRCLDSPKCIPESNEESNLNLIQKATAAIESLESLKDKQKSSNLLYKKSKHILRSGKRGGCSPELFKQTSDLEFFEDQKERKLTRAEAEKLISRLQGSLKQCKK